MVIGNELIVTRNRLYNPDVTHQIPATLGKEALSNCCNTFFKQFIIYTFIFSMYQGLLFISIKPNKKCYLVTLMCNSFKSIDFSGFFLVTTVAKDVTQKCYLYGD